MTSLVITSLLAAFIGSAPSTGNGFYIVDRNDMDCVIAGAGTYMQSKSDPVTIQLAACKMNKSGMAILRAYPKYPQGTDYVEKAESIKLTKAQLSCLSDNNFIRHFIPASVMQDRKLYLKIPTDFSC